VPRSVRRGGAGQRTNDAETPCTSTSRCPAGQKITVTRIFSLNVARPADRFPTSRGRHRHRHHAGDDQVSMLPWPRPMADGAKIVWMELFAGEKSTRSTGRTSWLPEETLARCADYVVSIKGR